MTCCARCILVLLLVLVPAVGVRAGDPEVPPQAQWGQWRGPSGTGVAPEGRPPVRWSEDHQVRWKTAIPGLGHASPVVWGDRVFIATAVAHGERLAVAPDAPGAHDNLPAAQRQSFDVLAIDRRNGAVLWHHTVIDEQPHEGAHETGGWASNSPVTDGRYVLAFFGSRGLYCLDPATGRIQWERDFGDMQTRHGHGEGSSPALHGDTVVVNWDHEGDSFITALDVHNGQTRWRVARDEATSWSTPLVVDVADRPQVVVSATGRVRGYDLATGAVIWECAGLSRNVVASPVAGGGMVFVGNSYDWQALLGIRLADARGDITGTPAVAWTKDGNTPYVPSPLLVGERLYYLKHLSGVLTCVDAATGRVLFGPVRLGGLDQVFASPVAAGGHVYVVARNGATMVLRDAAALEVVALNTLDESFSASPAIVGDALFLRGERWLYCLADAPAATATPGEGLTAPRPKP